MSREGAFEDLVAAAALLCAGDPRMITKNQISTPHACTQTPPCRRPSCLSPDHRGRCRRRGAELVLASVPAIPSQSTGMALSRSHLARPGRGLAQAGETALWWRSYLTL